MNILEGAENFITTIDKGLEVLSVDTTQLVEMDHLCYRVETYERYRELKSQLEEEQMLLGENEVSGRMISTFRLNKTIDVGRWRVSYLELPAPKEGSPYPEGLEHAEFVVLGGNLDTFEQSHSHLHDKFKYTGMTKSVNPELGLKAGGISVKFHRLPLGEVVRIESLGISD